MADTEIRTGPRPQRGAAARIRLDVAEWLVLRAALLEAVPHAALPPDFDPPAFGLDASRPLTATEQDRAWAALAARGVTRDGARGLAGLVPGFAAGLLGLVESELHIDVVSWSAETGIHQAIAWARGRAVTLARRRRTATRDDGRRTTEQEPVVEISLRGERGLIEEVGRALPRHDVASSAGPATPVRIGWSESAAVAQAMRSGRQDVAAHLSGLPVEALALLGSVSTQLRAGAHVTLGRAGEPARVHGAWLWTDTDVVELLGATEDAVVLRRTTNEHLRSGLLSTLTGLLHAQPDPLGGGS